MFEVTLDILYLEALFGTLGRWFLDRELVRPVQVVEILVLCHQEHLANLGEDGVTLFFVGGSIHRC